AELDALLQKYDAVVVPTRGAVAPPIGYDFDQPPGPPPPSPPPDAPRPPATIPAGNLAGLPALAVPMGFGRDGLPTSPQLLGRAFSERALLAVGRRFQQATDWHARRPALDHLPEPAAAARARGPHPDWAAHAEPGRGDLYRL